MKVPECISVVDAGGHLLAIARMDGAFALSIDTALRKARPPRPMACRPATSPPGSTSSSPSRQRRAHHLPGGLPVSSMANHRRRSASAPAPASRTAMVAAAVLGAVAGAKRLTF